MGMLNFTQQQRQKKKKKEKEGKKEHSEGRLQVVLRSPQDLTNSLRHGVSALAIPHVSEDTNKTCLLPTTLLSEVKKSLSRDGY